MSMGETHKRVADHHIHDSFVLRVKSYKRVAIKFLITEKYKKYTQYALYNLKLNLENTIYSTAERRLFAFTDNIEPFYSCSKNYVGTLAYAGISST